MTNNERTQLIDFPENATTEYFENLGFTEVEAIKLKWKFRAQLRREKEKLQEIELRRELLEEKAYMFSPNANPNYILLDTCSLQFEKGTERIDKSKRVVVMESILNEWDKVLLKKKRKKVKTENDTKLIKNIKKYRKEVATNSKYKIEIDTENMKFNYCDDKILNYLKNLPEYNRPTLLTADINLANRAKGYGLEYILILKHDNSKSTENLNVQEQETKNNVKKEKEDIEDNKSLHFQGVSCKVENNNIVVRKFNPHAKVFVVVSKEIEEITKRREKQIFEISKLDYIIVLGKQKTNREIKAIKIVIVNGEMQVNEEIYTFLNDIYLSKILSNELQEKAKRLMIN